MKGRGFIIYGVHFMGEDSNGKIFFYLMICLNDGFDLVVI